MKKTLASTVAAVLVLAILPITAPAQTAPGYMPQGAQFRVLTKAEQQATTKAAINNGMVQTIALLEQRFDTLSSQVSTNQYHLTEADVVAGLGDADAAKAARGGALLLGTIIKANVIAGNEVTKAWVAQEWVHDWITKYKLDPATGDPLPAQ